MDGCEDKTVDTWMYIWMDDISVACTAHRWYDCDGMVRLNSLSSPS